MATATLAEIMDALADQIDSVLADVTDVAVQVNSRFLRNPTLPAIDMWPGTPSSDPDTRAFGAFVGAEMIVVRARVLLSDTEAGQDLLLGLMDDVDPLSVLAALHENPTLDGILEDLDVIERTGYEPGFGGESEIIEVMWSVRAIKARS